jgi:hypothetical protein
MHVPTSQAPVTAHYNRLAAVDGGTCLSHKLPVLFELPFYIYGLMTGIARGVSSKSSILCPLMLPLLETFKAFVFQNNLQ